MNQKWILAETRVEYMRNANVDKIQTENGNGGKDYEISLSSLLGKIMASFWLAPIESHPLRSMCGWVCLFHYGLLLVLSALFVFAHEIFVQIELKHLTTHFYLSLSWLKP